MPPPLHSEEDLLHAVGSLFPHCCRHASSGCLFDADACICPLGLCGESRGRRDLKKEAADSRSTPTT
ncbi:hypothetical protein Y1Q_0007414 [Alligator mississippiensis]|uniref:Uncharacterized protein n=1 Tax=Alligator mississippiensis TaxID=8496 RepID=A0A151P7X2_ALLMI|nr:hypothetical protein Y1Q_0007414 [Alligator mississippiensis]